MRTRNVRSIAIAVGLTLSFVATSTVSQASPRFAVESISATAPAFAKVGSTLNFKRKVTTTTTAQNSALRSIGRSITSAYRVQIKYTVVASGKNLEKSSITSARVKNIKTKLVAAGVPAGKISFVKVTKPKSFATPQAWIEWIPSLVESNYAFTTPSSTPVTLNLPAGTKCMSFEVVGGQGGMAVSSSQTAGLGGLVTGQLSTRGFSAVEILVAGRGGTATSSQPGLGGQNGGAIGGSGSGPIPSHAGGGGGGFSSIKHASTSLVVAGGGGGAASGFPDYLGGNGGNAGVAGTDGSSRGNGGGPGGFGGGAGTLIGPGLGGSVSQSDGVGEMAGADGIGTSGGAGASGARYAAGGGGGGYFGGGGGGFSGLDTITSFFGTGGGGGGGSSYGPAGATIGHNQAGGDGYVNIYLTNWSIGDCLAR